MRYFIRIAIASCLLCVPAKSFASEIFVKIGPELGYINGDSTYHISFEEAWANGGHGESELEFPLDNSMIGMGLIIGSRHAKTDQVMGRFGLTWLVIPSGDAGIMKDSDWVENDAIYGEAPHAGKDMYTESNAQAKGTIFDISYAYHFRCNNSLTLGPLVGYRYHQFEYDIIGARGSYYTTPVSLAGRVMEYEVNYKIPYIGLSSGLIFGVNNQFELHLSLSYSDWANANDRDDHILRYKLSEGDCLGDAYLISLNWDWKFRPNWTLGLGAEYVDIDTSGTQHQSYYAGTSAGATASDINDTITSSSWSVLLSVSYWGSMKSQSHF